MKTIKEIADMAGVSKQKVYRYIRQNYINEALHDAGVMWFSEAVADCIISHFSEKIHINEAHQEVHHDAVSDAVISMLKNELEMKNEQIRELNARLSESNAALLSVQQSAQAAQALHAGTIRQLNSSGKKKNKWWDRIKRT